MAPKTMQNSLKSINGAQIERAFSAEGVQVHRLHFAALSIISRPQFCLLKWAGRISMLLNRPGGTPMCTRVVARTADLTINGAGRLAASGKSDRACLVPL